MCAIPINFCGAQWWWRKWWWWYTLVHWLYDFQLPWPQIDALKSTVDGDDECDALMNVVAVKWNEPNKVAVFARWSNSQKAHQQFWATFSPLRCQFSYTVECLTTFYVMQRLFTLLWYGIIVYFVMLCKCNTSSLCYLMQHLFTLLCYATLVHLFMLCNACSLGYVMQHLFTLLCYAMLVHFLHRPCFWLKVNGVTWKRMLENIKCCNTGRGYFTGHYLGCKDC